MLRIANDCGAGGLTAYVFTRDLAKAERYASELRYGEVQINGEAVTLDCYTLTYRVRSKTAGGYAKTGEGRLLRPVCEGPVMAIFENPARLARARFVPPWSGPSGARSHGSSAT